MKKVTLAIIFLTLWTIGVVGVNRKINLYLQAKKEKAQTVDPKAVPDNPSKLHSRFVLDTIDQATLVDLDKDGTEEAVVISHYADQRDNVFIYYGLYQFLPETKQWVELHADQINILNLHPELYEGKIDKPEEFRQQFTQMYTTRLTKIRNVGDLTGDGCPEILVSSLLQGKKQALFYRLVGFGPDNFRFIAAENELPFGSVIVERSTLVEVYKDLETGQFRKAVKAWDSQKGYFVKTYDKPTTPPGDYFPPLEPTG